MGYGSTIAEQSNSLGGPEGNEDIVRMIQKTSSNGCFDSPEVESEGDESDSSSITCGEVDDNEDEAFVVCPNPQDSDFSQLSSRTRVSRRTERSAEKQVLNSSFSSNMVKDKKTTVVDKLQQEESDSTIGVDIVNKCPSVLKRAAMTTSSSDDSIKAELLVSKAEEDAMDFLGNFFLGRATVESQKCAQPTPCKTSSITVVESSWKEKIANWRKKWVSNTPSKTTRVAVSSPALPPSSPLGPQEKKPNTYSQSPRRSSSSLPRQGKQQQLHTYAQSSSTLTRRSSADCTVTLKAQSPTIQRRSSVDSTRRSIFDGVAIEKYQECEVWLPNDDDDYFHVNNQMKHPPPSNNRRSVRTQRSLSLPEMKPLVSSAALMNRKKSSMKRAGSSSSLSAIGEGSKHSVKFTDVKFRHFDVEISDHPSCSDGPPIQLSWKYEKNESVYPLEHYEESRLPRRRSRNLTLDYYRRYVLLNQAGYTSLEMREAVEEVARVRQQRRLSATDDSNSRPLVQSMTDFLRSKW